MNKSIPDGVYPTMITPFTDDNKIDYDAVLRLIQWYDAHGVDGIFAICQSSEIFYLSFEERLELLQFIVQNTPKHITILASGHTASDLNMQIYEANQFIETGIDGYVFIANRFAEEHEGEDILLHNIERVVSALPDTIFGLYECPYPYKRVLQPETLGALASTGKFQFLKDTCCDLSMMEQKLEAVKGKGLKIFNAVASTLLESLHMGCAGYSGVMANYHPDIYGWICENFRNNSDKLRMINDVITAVSALETRSYPVSAKYYLNNDGVSMGLTTRAVDQANFTNNLKLEFDSLKRVTDYFKRELL